MVAQVSIPGMDETVWSRKTEKKVPFVVTQINKTLEVPSVEIQVTHQCDGTESGNIGGVPSESSAPPKHEQIRLSASAIKAFLNAFQRLSLLLPQSHIRQTLS